MLTRTLYVGPMSSSVSEDEVNEVFSRFGEVMSVIVSLKYDLEEKLVTYKLRLVCKAH